MLQANNLEFSYQDGSQTRKILDGVSASFDRGVFYTILGQSGTGKTTLLSMLSALDVPDTGTVTYEGIDIQKIGLSKYRRNTIGIVFQQFNLVPYMSALQNVLVAMSITDNQVGGQERALEILASLGIDKDKALRNVKKLSGGEQQRVAIARALATDVDVIFADEPTGNLDVKTQKEIVEIFKDLTLNHDKCVIVVTHSNSVARSSDVILTMQDGKLVESR